MILDLLKLLVVYLKINCNLCYHIQPFSYFIKIYFINCINNIFRRILISMDTHADPMQLNIYAIIITNLFY